ncbi:MAG: hypothetical protein PHT33_06385 [bacterium]|nr:hypothetical protein [bacterium]
MIVDALVEGPTDEAVAKKLIAAYYHEYGTTYGKQGHGYLCKKASGFAVHAQYGNPILMLVDFMDTGYMCPGEVPAAWLPNPCEKLLLRVVVREIESWLLADAEGLAEYLGVSKVRIPSAPEILIDPKQTLINIARYSRKAYLRDAIVPKINCSANAGPEYVDAIKEFVYKHWNIEAALNRSLSLSKCVKRLGEL